MKNIPIMDDMNDYISNPKCDEWNNDLSNYNVGVIYKWTYKADGTTGLRYIKVKHESHAKRLFEYWNSIQDGYCYEQI